MALYCTVDGSAGRSHPSTLSAAVAKLEAAGCPRPVRYIILESPADPNILFAITTSAVRRCGVLRALLDVADLAEDSVADAVVPTFMVPDASKERLKDVCDYLCDAAKLGPPSPLPRPLLVPLQEMIAPWESAYLQRIGKDASRICEIMRVADVLEVDSLLELTCAHLASLLQQCCGDAEVAALFKRPVPTEEELEGLVTHLSFLQGGTGYQVEPS